MIDYLIIFEKHKIDFGSEDGKELYIPVLGLSRQL